MPRMAYGRLVFIAVAATAAVISSAATRAQDTELSVDQVPEEKQLQQDAQDEGLLSEDVPDRCADPDVAAKDPECVPKRRRESVSESYGIPVIEDPSSENSELLPGVTINQSRGAGR